MNQSEFIAAVAQELGITKVKAKETLEGISKVILSGVHKHENIAFPNLGRFGKKTTKARSCRNPRTGELMKVAPKTKIIFTASAATKDSVANG